MTQTEYGCERGTGGGTLSVRVTDKAFELASGDTGASGIYRTFTVEEVKLRKRGKHTLTVEPSPRTPRLPLSLKSIALVPVR